MRRPSVSRLVIFSLFLIHAVVYGQPPELRDLDSHCPFSPPDSVEAWQARADDLKLQLQVSLGVFPNLELDPVRPNIYGKTFHDGYSIEKVTFESLPGFFVTGNLYRPLPTQASGLQAQKLPGILCPHGHWREARFHEASPGEVKQLLASGAERFESAAINHIQARCVQLARMGCVVFHWDMVGYCDCTQISYERAHRFQNQPQEEEINEEGWLLFSPLAESHGQSVMALQTIGTQRAVDLLLSLPEVDPQRIAITGASGGGTQSFIGAALDDRIQVAFPAVMVSTGMQGGCTCENACLLRVGTGNVEMAGLIAPRPLGLTAANDWTRTMPQDGFPELRKLYGLLGAENKVSLFPAIHFGHNFNHVSRVSMYGWMNQHFGLELETPILERDFELSRKSELTVWDAEHPAPPGGEPFERKLNRLWAAIVQAQLHGLLEGDEGQLQELVDTIRDGWRVCLGLTTLPYGQIEVRDSVDQAGAFVLQADGFQPWSLRPQPARPRADNSDFGSIDASGLKHDQELQDVWKPSHADLHVEVGPAGGKGESLFFYPALDGETTTPKIDHEGEYVFLRTMQQRLVKNPRLAAAYTYGYNLPLFATRAQQLGLALDWLSKEFPDSVITVRGRDRDAALAAAGVFCAITGKPTAELGKIRLNLEPGDFRFDQVKNIRDPNFLPSSARFMDLPGLLAALRAIHIEITGADLSSFQKLQRVHDAAGNSLKLNSPAS